MFDLPVIFLHGWGSNPANWRPVIQRLRQKRLVVLAPLLPGFGSTTLSRPWNTADYSRWLFRFLGRHNITSCYLIGHSFGGQIAINFTAKYPAKVQKLTLIGSAGIRNELNPKRVILGLLSEVGKWLVPNRVKAMIYNFIKARDYYAATPVMKQTLQQVLVEDQQTFMAKIKIPTLLIWGRHDTFTPLRQGQIIHRLIPNSRLVIIPDGRHGLHYTHVPQLAEKILWFLGSK